MNEIVSENKVYKNAGNGPVIDCITGIQQYVLDVGCGAGDNASVLVDKGHIVDGITLSYQEAETCKMWMQKVWIHNLETGLPHDLDGKYDYVICSHVLEHIVYPQRLLNDIKMRLKPDGKLIVALPNIMHYQSRFKLIFGQFEYQDTGIWDYTHVRWYTFTSGAKLLEGMGFQIIKKDVSGEIPFLTILRFIPSPVRQLLYRGLGKLSKGFFGGQLIYVVKPNSTN